MCSLWSTFWNKFCTVVQPFFTFNKPDLAISELYFLFRFKPYSEQVFKFLLYRPFYTSPIICIIDELVHNAQYDTNSYSLQICLLLYLHYSKSTTCSIDTLAFFCHLRQMTLKITFLLYSYIFLL